jgi:hypothetical protein
METTWVRKFLETLLVIELRKTISKLDLGVHQKVYRQYFHSAKGLGTKRTCIWRRIVINVRCRVLKPQNIPPALMRHTSFQTICNVRRLLTNQVVVEYAEELNEIIDSAIKRTCWEGNNNISASCCTRKTSSLFMGQPPLKSISVSIFLR